ncbi:hypothetical protein QCA50_005290 [Cerrena zonata]|uniref:Uncharacterized protein n=1 Tax=Cerrena zonata TaxID=2478898 RepID=A0AAW0GGK0_9APHY
MHKRWIFLILLALVLYVSAQNTSDIVSNDTSTDTDDGSYPHDPYLRYRPSFAMSLPVQILVTGIVLTLTSVLFIHLIFTAQYHWPLAPVNFALQMSAVFTLLISHIATLQVILSTATRESQSWPYMLTYVSVDTPPLDTMEEWTTGELAAWLLMNATTSALIQITHIQFLTLLFPSGLERRLIFTLLGPLAIVASVMQLLPLRDAEDKRLLDISTAIQNVCNATLSLLFTGALFIWGLLVNRKQAWRTDGGTAAFGAGALTLALASTAITFVYIPSKDQYAWMPGLMWAIILWQSFLGWWWWVGSGMGVGEVEELLRREEKRRRRRRIKLAKRKERKEKVDTFWKGVAGALGYDRKARTTQSDEDGDFSDEAQSPAQSGDERSPRLPRPRLRRPSQESATESLQSQSKTIPRMLQTTVGRVIYGWYASLRHAHLKAAREQAEEHVERMQQVYGREGDAQASNREPPVMGWGLGSYTIRQVGAGAEHREDDQNSDQDDARTLREEEPPEQENDIQLHENETSHSRRRRRKGRNKVEGDNPPPPDQVDDRPSSMWWWGPLQRWRLQDSTVYS